MKRRINPEIKQGELDENLKKYMEKAYELGASRAKILETKEVVFDLRAKYKCAIPKCGLYGSCANCPPYAPSLKESRELTTFFNCALLIGVELPSAEVIKDNEMKPNEEISPKYRTKLQEIVSNIEASAFYDGYYFAMGFGSGACKKLWCPESPCSVLDGKGCRQPLKARPSMEAVGMDVFKMVSNAGWSVYPVGHECSEKEISHGLFAGIVLIN